MYITTSRKPSDATRRLARMAANFIGTYENRGKKTVEEIAARADELGHSRAMLISESGGSPSSIIFMSAGEDWEWLEPELIVSVKPESLARIGKLGKKVSYQGDAKYAHLFDLKEPETDDVVVIRMDDNELSFSCKKLKLAIRIRERRHLVKE